MPAHLRRRWIGCIGRGRGFSRRQRHIVELEVLGDIIAFRIRHLEGAVSIIDLGRPHLLFHPYFHIRGLRRSLYIHRLIGGQYARRDGNRTCFVGKQVHAVSIDIPFQLIGTVPAGKILRQRADRQRRHIAHLGAHPRFVQHQARQVRHFPVIDFAVYRFGSSKMCICLPHAGKNINCFIFWCGVFPRTVC